MKKKNFYQTPEIGIVDMVTEQCFATSTTPAWYEEEKGNGQFGWSYGTDETWG